VRTLQCNTSLQCLMRLFLSSKSKSQYLLSSSIDMHRHQGSSVHDDNDNDCDCNAIDAMMRRVTLSWYDPPSVYGTTGSVLINNLDLLVVAPSGRK
jgi:hypothetical protein